MEDNMGGKPQQNQQTVEDRQTKQQIQTNGYKYEETKGVALFRFIVNTLVLGATIFA